METSRTGSEARAETGSVVLMGEGADRELGFLPNGLR